MNLLEPHKTVFDNNVNLIQRFDPELAQRLQQCEPSSQYVLMETPSCHPTLIFTGGKRPLYLHSGKDPKTEGQREIQSLAANESSVYVILGLGLGYSLESLLETETADIAGLLLVERDIDIFYYFLHRRDWSALLSHPAVRIVIADKPEKIIPAAKSLLPQIMGSGLRFIDHRPSTQLFNEFYTEGVDCLRHFLQRAIAESEFLVLHGALIQRNALLNLPAICASHGLGPLRDFYKNQPAILVAAGPSLGKNIGILSQYRSKALVFCVDTAYPVARQHGVYPDFIAATDPTELNTRHFEGIQPDKNEILLFESDVHPAIPARWPGPKIFINSEKAAINRWIERVAGPFGTFDQGLSVAHTLFNAAVWMGCDPIVFIGFDLAYDMEGGMTHAAGTALNRKIVRFKEGDSTIVIKGAPFHPDDTQEEIVWVLGVRGKLTPTSKPMAVFLQKLSENIRQCQRRVFDATEGGALIEGSIPTRLINVLSSLEEGISQPDMVSFLKEHQDPQERSRLTAFDEMIENLRLIAEEAKCGLELTNALLKNESRIESPTLRDEPEWKRIDRHFWNIYRKHELQIALEQALFPAMFMFIRRTKNESNLVRLNKYAQVFDAVVRLVDEFIPCIEES
ncbi:MAG: 6-hydroxymethylpterin diphosphokinase MptE-like protein, partial [Candidatus Omnitrophota bacterium]